MKTHTYRITVTAIAYLETVLEAQSQEEAINKAKEDNDIDWELYCDGSQDDYEVEVLK
jgi:hypothetical protein